jgi:hypothetical protein
MRSYTKGMSMKTFVWGGFFIGSTIGQFVPYIWDSTSMFSFSSIILSGVFGMAGIYAGYKIGKGLGV